MKYRNLLLPRVTMAGLQSQQVEPNKLVEILAVLFSSIIDFRYNSCNDKRSCGWLLLMCTFEVLYYIIQTVFSGMTVLVCVLALWA